VYITVVHFDLTELFLYRYCDSLSYALKSRRAEKQKDTVNQRLYYEKMLKEDSDVALLRVFECFLEAAPQQILQISVLLRDNKDESTFHCKLP
jgi:XK-related protein.